MKRNPVLIVMSILAGLQVLAGGAALADVLGQAAAGLFILTVAAAQMGLQFYVRGEVVPVGRAQELVDAAARTGLPVNVANTRVGHDPYQPRHRAGDVGLAATGVLLRLVPAAVLGLVLALLLL